MELQFIDYRGSRRRQFLLFYLGTRAGKIIGLESDMVTQRDAIAIRSAANLLDGFSLDRRLGWIKEYCPTSYASGFRTLSEAKATVLSKHEINQT